VIYFVLLGLVVVPLLALGLLQVIGLFSPRVRREGRQQLSQPFRLRGGTVSEYELAKQRRRLEDETIRRFGKPD
jgi:hypothetical protein